MTGASGDGFPWAWLYYRALDCGMSASDFWNSSPRAVMALYACAKASHRTPAANGRAMQRAPAAAPAGQRLARLPR